MYYHLLYGSVYCLLLFLFFVCRSFIRSRTPSSNDAEFKSFQRQYLIVYLLIAAGEWLQKPHLYALYDSIGLSKHKIEVLFAIGILSETISRAVLHTFPINLGGRRNILVYSILFGSACLCYHSTSFFTLLLGRVISGIAFSFLCCSMEIWLFTEQQCRGFSATQCQTISTNAITGSLFVAVFSGLLSQYLSEKIGLLAPFDLSILILMITMTIVIANFLEVQENKPEHGTFNLSIQKPHHSLDESLFKGSLYLFSFLWTPIISRSVGAYMLPHGHIFAATAAAALFGSFGFQILSRYRNPENYLPFFFLFAGFGLVFSIFSPDEFQPVFTGFMLFAFTSGIIYPTIQGFHTNVESVPGVLLPSLVNLIVVVTLFQNFPIILTTQICVIFTLTASIIQFLNSSKPQKYEKLPVNEPNEYYV